MSKTLQHQISLTEAIELTTRFRNNPGEDMPLCETFEKESVMRLLNESDCHALRIYLGRKPDNRICSVLVGADAEGHDILPQEEKNELTEDDEEIILEDAFHCPPSCPPPSPLNE